MATPGAGRPTRAEGGHVHFGHLVQSRSRPRRQEAGKARRHAGTGRHRYPAPARLAVQVKQGTSLTGVVRNRHHGHGRPEARRHQVTIWARRRYQHDPGTLQDGSEGRRPELYEPYDARRPQGRHPGFGQSRLSGQDDKLADGLGGKQLASAAGTHGAQTYENGSH
jgi:hypothetical protein